MLKLRAWAFLICALFSSGIIMAILAPLALLGRWGAFLWIHVWATNGIACSRYLLNIKYEVKGNIPDHPVIYAVKHQSAWETGFMQTILPRAVYIYKNILKYIPVYGLMMYLAGYIAVDRQSNAAALRKIVKGVKKQMAKGSSIIIAPEGTRVPYGKRGEIRPGVIALYKMTDAEVVPVSLNSGKFWPRNSFIKTPGTITVTFHEPIPKGLSREEFVKVLEEKINFSNPPL